MKIREIYIKNFGKFSEQRFSFQPGVNILYGENEFGKSTLCAFIRAMLFGMERGRGKAAARDDFSRYEPWENPNHYAGSMRFTCGGRNFLLERSFDRYTKHVSLVCEDDGEELSVEQGDLDMLLGGLTSSVFDNTVLVRQMAAEPGQELSHSLKNYAANYYETGGGEVDLQGTLKTLKDREREVQQRQRALAEKEEKKRANLRQECSYIEADMEGLRRKLEENQRKYNQLEREETRLSREYARLKEARKTQEANSEKENTDTEGTERKMGPALIKGGAAGVLVGLAGFFWGGFLTGQEWFPGSIPLRFISTVILAVGVILLAAGAVRLIKEKREERKTAGRWREAANPRFARSSRRYGTSWHGDESASQGTAGQSDEAAEQRIHEAGQRYEAARESVKRRLWQQEQIQADWKEKEIRLKNLQEAYMEMEVPEEVRLTEKQLKALKLAQESVKTAAAGMGQRTGELLDRRASEIFSAVTNGRYRGLRMSENMDITVWDGKRNISLHLLSRGTIEQIYFSIRMAAAEFLCEEELPVILDDVFAFYDEKRVKSALKWLRDEKKQAIIFTCQKREEEIFYGDMEGRM